MRWQDGKQEVDPPKVEGEQEGGLQAEGEQEGGVHAEGEQAVAVATNMPRKLSRSEAAEEYEDM